MGMFRSSRTFRGLVPAGKNTWLSLQCSPRRPGSYSYSNVYSYSNRNVYSNSNSDVYANTNANAQAGS